MDNNIIIFRTDRIGDLLVSCPAIISIKKNIKNSNITLIASQKNYEYAKGLNIFDEVYKFPSNIFLKIFFIFKLIKKRFDYVFVFDGKERSIITSCLIRSKNKVALTPKIKKIYKIFNIKFFKDDDETNLNQIFQDFLSYLNINGKINHFNFLKDKTNNKFSSEIKISDYIHIHFDEKWFSELYISKYTNISPNYNEFVTFLDTISDLNDVLITTGLVDFTLIDELKKNYFKKISDKIFLKKNKNKLVYFIYKPSFDDLESLLRKTKILISCHGSITHAANSFDNKKIDILEENKLNFYHPIYRSKFNLLSNQILNKII